MEQQAEKMIGLWIQFPEMIFKCITEHSERMIISQYVRRENSFEIIYRKRMDKNSIAELIGIVPIGKLVS